MSRSPAVRTRCGPTTRSTCRARAASTIAAGRRRLRPRRSRGAGRTRRIRCSSCRSRDVQADTGLHFAAGGPAAKRELNVLIGKNVEAGRIMAGVTFSEPGNWTSWPPHEHAVLAEEAYLYIDMPRAGVRRAARLHEPARARARDHRPRRRRRADAAGLPPECGGARRRDQLSLDDGGHARGRRPAVRRRQRAAGICHGGSGLDPGKADKK